MQNKSLDRKDGITLNVLSAVEADSKVTQRSLATDLGVALGLTNAYLKRCVDKGLVKINHVPRNRYLYYLTPQGFSEKARLTAEYLRSSLNFYRRARDECKEIIVRCEKKGIKNIILSDQTELSEILILSTLGTTVSVVGILGKKNNKYLGVSVFENIPKSLKFEIIIITSMRSADRRYKNLSKKFTKRKIILPSILTKNVSNNRHE